VFNYNHISPKTSFDPEVIGYTQSADGVHIMLHIVEKGCLVICRHYPQMAIWAMMKSRPASAAAMDKSGDSYAKIITKRDAFVEKLRSRSADDPSQDSPDIAPVNDGSFGDID
jgi:hypothetical protein